jgi:hypothetical protein
LQKLVGIFEDVTQPVALSAQSLGGKLRSHLDAGHGAVFRHKANLVNSNAGFARKRRLQLFGQSAGLRGACGESTHKAGKLSLVQVACKMDAGDARSDQQLRETALGGRGAEGNTIKQDLIAGGSQQQAGVSAFVEREAQFLPGGLKLTHGTHVAEFVEAGKLEQDIQAANESARG